MIWAKRIYAVAAALAVALIVYLAVAWLVVMNTDACWWPWQELRFPDGHVTCISGM